MKCSSSALEGVSECRTLQLWVLALLGILWVLLSTGSLSPFLISAEGEFKYYRNILIFNKALQYDPKFTQEKS